MPLWRQLISKKFEWLRSISVWRRDFSNTPSERLLIHSFVHTDDSPLLLTSTPDEKVAGNQNCLISGSCWFYSAPWASFQNYNRRWQGSQEHVSISRTQVQPHNRVKEASTQQLLRFECETTTSELRRRRAGIGGGEGGGGEEEEEEEENEEEEEKEAHLLKRVAELQPLIFRQPNCFIERLQKTQLVRSRTPSVSSSSSQMINQNWKKKLNLQHQSWNINDELRVLL